MLRLVLQATRRDAMTQRSALHPVRQQLYSKVNHNGSSHTVLFNIHKSRQYLRRYDICWYVFRWYVFRRYNFRQTEIVLTEVMLSLCECRPKQL